MSVIDMITKYQDYYNLLQWKINQQLLIQKKPMRTQFFYTRKEVVANGAPTRPNQEAVVSYKRDSFNLNAVIRSIEMADGSVLVLLNDIHERTTETPNISVKSNKVTGTIRKRDTFQSEIYLSKEDGERFYRCAAVDEPLIAHNSIPNPTHDGIQETVGAESLSGDTRGAKK